MKALRYASVASALVVSIYACGGTSTDNGFGNTPPGGSDSGAGGGDATMSLGDSGKPGSFGDAFADGTQVGDASCATATAETTRQPVYMLFVVDGSGSMAMQNKWTALVPALDAIFDNFLSSMDPNFGAGMIIFSDTNDPTCSLGCNGPYPSSIDVPIAYVDQAQHDKLRGRVDPTSPMDGTPTYAALSGGWGELEAFTPQLPLKPNGKKVLVILTDGVPTDGSNAQCIASAGTELAKAPPAGPITTFVVGVGDFPSSNLMNFDPTFLGQLAQAGGAAPMGCNPNENTDVTKVCYFEVDPSKAATAQQLQQQFIAAIQAIQGQVSSCTFPLSVLDGGVIDPNKVNVIFTDSMGNMVVIPQDPVNGWTYDNPTNPTAVILHGTACQNLKMEVNSKISIQLGCATQKPH